MNNKTHSVKLNEIEKKWYIIDAANKPLGRVATEVAKLLRGKHKPTFSAHIDCGDHVIVINTDKMVLTGDKLNQKMFRRHSGYVGGMKETPYKNMMDKKSDFVLTHAVKGMLPKNSLGRKMLTKVRAYKGSEHDQQAQQPEIWNF
ncbi:MAG: 50S ribosomal protein L13 [Clostridia bacterium]|nr:50S ribosomal protein L13 [Clostridia bacterium]MDD4375984.1 50S ribosomal protein L13 [Clostridia bacterium]